MLSPVVTCSSFSLFAVKCSTTDSAAVLMGGCVCVCEEWAFTDGITLNVWHDESMC